MSLYKFAPQFVEKIWGGRRLERLGKSLPPGKIGESWEVSGHRAHLTPVAGGEDDGKDLYALASARGKAVFGSLTEACLEEFPLLLKFLDADDVLSVQVHPRDEYAREHEDSLGKTEAWIIVEAEPGAYLYKGFEAGATLDDFDRLLPEARLEEILHKVPATAGDCIPLPAGTVHAIGKGILLCEIQQSSDVTYRVYDWGRLGRDGKPRPLHVERARDVMDVAPPEEDKARAEASPLEAGERERLFSCPYFSLERIRARGETEVSLPGNVFALVCVLEGEGELMAAGKAEKVRRGDSLLVAAETAVLRARAAKEELVFALALACPGEGGP